MKKGITFFVVIAILLALWPASSASAYEPTRWRTMRVEDVIAPIEIEELIKGHPKMEYQLNRLLEAYCHEGLAKAQTFAKTHAMVLEDDYVQVVIQLTTQEAISDLREAVQALGGEYQCHYERLLQALVPIDALESLAERLDVQVIREPHRPILAESVGVGTVGTEGLEPSNAAAWHLAGYTGSGVRVAVIDGGFTNYASLLDSDLPASVTTYDWTGSGMGGSLHGTACAEIVYDMAPGATMYLHKISTDVELGNAVNRAIADGVDIISMSLGWTLGGPGDGTGFLANIVSQARSNGIFFATAAGNNAEHCWSGTFTDTNADGLHEWAAGQNIDYFGPGTGSAYILPVGSPIQVFLHWDDWTNVNQDYRMELYRWTGSSWQFVVLSDRLQNGGAGQTPEEWIVINAPFEAPYGVVVKKMSATRDVCLRLIASHNGPELDERVPERSLIFPADSTDAITVGAIDVSTYSLEPYSSQGPTFGSGGTCYGGSTKPDIAAYARVSTVSYGSAEFAGTSAATPHVAGAAALVAEAYPSYTPAQIQAFLEGRAVDLGAPGKDNMYGSGRLYLGPPEIGQPDITVSPPSFDVTLPSNTIQNYTLTIGNDGGDALNYSISDEDCPWLDENPKSGSVPAGGSTDITVTINTAGLTVGNTYTAEIIIANNDPDENPEVVPVTLHVAPNNPPQLSNPSVQPPSGTPATDFYYFVNYFDSDGDSPSVKQVYIDGIPYTMSLYSGSVSNGVYRYGPKNLVAGSHNYYFYFTDGKGGIARLPTSGSYSGPTITTISLGEAVDNNGLTWTTGGDGNWFGQTGTYYYGGDAAQSGSITHNQATSLQTTVTGPGTLTFYWKVSSQVSYDWLRFYIDGVQQASMSGSVDWQQRSYSITSGTHTLEWRYTKDGSVSSGSDCGWVDKVDFTFTGPPPSVPTLKSPASGLTVPGLTPRLEWNASSGAVSYGLQVSTSSSFTSLVVDETGITDLFYDVPEATLNWNMVYYWRVNAANSYDSTSGWSSYRYFRTAVGPPPEAPSDLIATPISSSRIDLTWQDNSSDEAGFKIERRTGSGSYSQIALVSADVTSYSNSRLSASTEYYYRVRAYKGTLNSDYCEEASATTLPPPPAAPTLKSPASGLTVPSLTPRLEWNASSGAVSYGLQVSTISSFTSLVIDETGITDLYYDIEPGILNWNTIYYWRVNASNSFDSTSGWSSYRYFRTAVGPPPEAPSDLIATPISSSRIDLTWQDNSDNESGFRIERRTGSGTYSQIATVGAGVTSYSNTILNAGATYYYRVRAYSAAGSSDYSNEASATTLPPPPAAPTLKSPASRSTVPTLTPRLEWNASSGAVSYGLQVSTSYRFTSLVIDETGITDLYYDIEPGILNWNTIYYWRVNASSSFDSTSSWSSYRYFRTAVGP